MAKVIISCAVTGAIHTPSMSDYLPITPEEIARSSIEAAEAGAAIIHLHARDPTTAGRRPTRRCSCVPAGDQAEHRCGGEHHHRRRPEHDAGRSAGRAAAGEARDVQPQHGQHELQHLPRRRPGEDLEARLGEAVSRPHRRPHLPQHVPRHRRHRRAAGQGARHALRVRVLRRRPSLQPGATASIRRSSSRRCSCRPSSASSAASAPIRAICCS